MMPDPWAERGYLYTSPHINIPRRFEGDATLLEEEVHRKRGERCGRDVCMIRRRLLLLRTRYYTGTIVRETHMCAARQSKGGRMKHNPANKLNIRFECTSGWYTFFSSFQSKSHGQRRRRLPPVCCWCCVTKMLVSYVPVYPYTTVYITPPPGGDFPWSISPQLECCRPPKRWALEASRRDLSEDVSFGMGTLLVVEQSSFENRPWGV